LPFISAPTLPCTRARRRARPPNARPAVLDRHAVERELGRLRDRFETRARPDEHRLDEPAARASSAADRLTASVG
jgi:hypothetical protein